MIQKGSENSMEKKFTAEEIMQLQARCRYWESVVRNENWKETFKKLERELDHLLAHLCPVTPRREEKNEEVKS